VNAPAEFADFTYGMAWHRRLRDDTMLCWLRAQVRTAANALDTRDVTMQRAH
jgi:hypothetical protein